MSDHGGLAHDERTLAKKGNTNLVHLVGSNIVNIDHVANLRTSIGFTLPWFLKPVSLTLRL